MVGIFLIIIILILLLYRQWNRRHLMKLGSALGPGTMALPFLGHSYMFIGAESRMKAFQTLGKDANKNGGLAPFWLGSHLYTVVTDPVFAEIILKTCLEKADTMRFAAGLIDNGSVFAPVRIWRPRRKFLLPSFGMKHLKHFITIFNKQSKILVEQLKNAADAGTVAMWSYFTSYTMDVIGETTLGYEINAQRTPNLKFLRVFDAGISITATRMVLPWLHFDAVFQKTQMYKELRRCREYLRGVVLPVLWDSSAGKSPRTGWDFKKADYNLLYASITYVDWTPLYELDLELIQSKRKEINELKSHKPESDQDAQKDDLKTILELLLHSDAEICTDTVVLEEMLVLLIAGNDTSAVGSCFVTVMLSRHPDVQDKVYQELLEVFGDSERDATVEDLASIKYLDAVIRETLRLYPPVPVIARKVETAVELPSGLTLVPGSSVLVNMWAMHRNPRYWGDDADQFRPERFLDANKPPAFMPFSHGPRSCLGYQFAMMSMKTAVSTLLRKYKILPATEPTSPNFAHPPFRLKFDLMMKDVDDFKVRIESRVKCT